ncbi:MAG: YihY/virulence factor BrkB family protein [Acidobacteriota bacterium]
MSRRFHLWQALLSFLSGNHLTYAAAIAYYTLFSFFPLILLLLSLGGAFIHRFGLEDSIIGSVRLYLPVGADMIEDNLRLISASRGEVSLIALFLLVWTASGAFIPLELALNESWGIKRERGFVHRRFIAAVMAILCGYLILASVFATAMLGRLGDFLQSLSQDRWLSGPAEWVVEILVVLLTFVIAIIMFALVYKIVPYAPMRFSQVAPAATYAALTWELAKYAFTFFISRSTYKNIYGSIATIIVILSWVYVSAAILLFFAEFSAQMQRRPRRT